MFNFSNKRGNVAQEGLASVLKALGVQGITKDMTVQELTDLSEQHLADKEVVQDPVSLAEVVETPAPAPAPTAKEGAPKTEDPAAEGGANAEEGQDIVAEEVVKTPEAVEAPIAVQSAVAIEAVAVQEAPSVSLEDFNALRGIVTAQQETIAQLVSQGNQFNANFQTLAPHIGALKNTPSQVIASAKDAVDVAAAPVLPVTSSGKNKKVTMSVGSFLSGQGKRPR